MARFLLFLTAALCLLAVIDSAKPKRKTVRDFFALSFAGDQSYPCREEGCCVLRHRDCDRLILICCKLSAACHLCRELPHEDLQITASHSIPAAIFFPSGGGSFWTSPKHVLDDVALQVSVTDEEVVKARDFALAEIVKLSDSYRDMKINKVLSAETARSVFPSPLAQCRPSLSW